MDLDTAVTAQYARSTIVWRDLEALIEGTGRWNQNSAAPEGNCHMKNPLWCNSLMNPAGRINSESPPHSIWRIDGSRDFGRSFYAWPAGLCPPVHPSYVKVTIPDSSLWPPSLPQILESSASVHTRTDRVAGLGIGKHVILALDSWSKGFEDFDSFYRQLPFGSHISIKNVAPKPEDMHVEVNSNPIATQTMTFADIESISGLSVDQLPPRKNPADFYMVKQLNEAVSVVKEAKRDNTLIMKASVDHLNRIYRELKTLLLVPEHPCLIGRPIYLLEAVIQGSSVIIGFVLEHHVEGSLKDVLLRESQLGCLNYHEQFHWSKQLTSTLIELQKVGRFAYRDIKTENVVLRRTSDGRRDIVLIDFENHGAPDSWTPPEVAHIENLRLIVQASKSNTDREEYREMLSTILGSNLRESKDGDFSFLTAQSVWEQLLSTREQEAVQVFGLGMIFYCIFEGVGCPTNRISESWGGDSETQYPHFRRTPEAVQRLILRCTAGSKLSNPDAKGVVRCGDKLYPRGMSGRNGEPLGNFRDIIVSSRQMWLQELQAIREFVPSRVRYQQQTATSDDIRRLAYLSRPRLREIMDALESIHYYNMPII